MSHRGGARGKNPVPSHSQRAQALQGAWRQVRGRKEQRAGACKALQVEGTNSDLVLRTRGF